MRQAPPRRHFANLLAAEQQRDQTAGCRTACEPAHAAHATHLLLGEAAGLAEGGLGVGAEELVEQLGRVHVVSLNY